MKVTLANISKGQQISALNILGFLFGDIFICRVSSELPLDVNWSNLVLIPWHSLKSCFCRKNTSQHKHPNISNPYSIAYARISLDGIYPLRWCFWVATRIVWFWYLPKQQSTLQVDMKIWHNDITNINIIYLQFSLGDFWKKYSIEASWCLLCWLELLALIPWHHNTI